MEDIFLKHRIRYYFSIQKLLTGNDSSDPPCRTTCLEKVGHDTELTLLSGNNRGEIFHLTLL